MELGSGTDQANRPAAVSSAIEDAPARQITRWAAERLAGMSSKNGFNSTFKTDIAIDRFRLVGSSARHCCTIRRRSRTWAEQGDRGWDLFAEDAGALAAAEPAGGFPVCPRRPIWQFPDAGDRRANRVAGQRQFDAGTFQHLHLLESWTILLARLARNRLARPIHRILLVQHGANFALLSGKDRRTTHSRRIRQRLTGFSRLIKARHCISPRNSWSAPLAFWQRPRLPARPPDVTICTVTCGKRSLKL